MIRAERFVGPNVSSPRYDFILPPASVRPSGQRDGIVTGR